MSISLHQPGSRPLDVPDQIPNPVHVPVPVPKEPVPPKPKTPEKVPEQV
jgi:hypothetical protein